MDVDRAGNASDGDQCCQCCYGDRLCVHDFGVIINKLAVVESSESKISVAALAGLCAFLPPESPPNNIGHPDWTDLQLTPCGPHPQRHQPDQPPQVD
jgi:hypothetical protein